MASDFTQKGKHEIVLQNLNVVTETGWRVILLQSSYSHDKNRNFVDDGTANDMASHETTVSGYTGGFGGSGRKTPTGRTVTRDDANARIEFTHATVTWSPSLGTGQTLGGVGHIVQKTTDGDSWVVAFDDSNDQATNGGEVDYVPNAEGILQF